MKAQTETYIQNAVFGKCNTFDLSLQAHYSKKENIIGRFAGDKKTARKSEPFKNDIQINTENYPTLPSRLWSNSNSVSFNLYMS